MQKIVTFLAFQDRMEEAVKMYTSIFKNSKIIDIVTLDNQAPGATDKVVVITFELDGQRYMAMNGGPYFTFSQGISLMVGCENQAEIDYFWEKLGEGGGHQECGWLKDRFGVSWQIVPKNIATLLSDSKNGNTKAVFDALMKMVKLDMATLEKAYRS
jgi:predicted 3-demethylubiquinone-9 3-methyltransferase (glyoxalase superfamily)